MGYKGDCGKKKERNEKFSLAKNFKSKNFTLGNAMAVVVYGVSGVYDYGLLWCEGLSCWDGGLGMVVSTSFAYTLRVQAFAIRC